jgi:ABC-type branched-subunit amino acid transport system permease subunit
VPQIPADEQQPGHPGGETRVGVDEWVASVEGRTEAGTGWIGRARRRLDRIPAPVVLGAAVAAAASFPLFTESDFLIRVGVNTILFALLALGLNVVVGYAGLLDLGYVAFYGFGAYMYAMLSSAKFDLHWPTELVLPLVVVASAILGLLLGLPSRRLVGDYLAIITLFFAQIFVTVVTNANRITPPWRDEPVDVTGGPNGIASLDQLSVFGLETTSVTHYFYFGLAVFVLVVVALHFVDRSRTGRAWRALREDPLAAELMGMPVDRLKLLAFAFGAATAGLTGTIFAAVQAGVFPGNFGLPLLIMIYAMVILGGAGSIAGVVIGATLITVLSEVLEQGEEARLVFYGVIVLGLVAFLRPWHRLAAVAGATAVLGLVVHLAADRIWERGTAGSIEGGGFVADAVERWVLLPSNPNEIANVAFVVLVAAAILLRSVRGVWRLAALVPVLYLAAFVWENKLVLEPSVTRNLLLGALLIVMMSARPQGLLGTPRVEIV